jgi:uncharacterized protein YecT (DUF1311 family)
MRPLFALLVLLSLAAAGSAHACGTPVKLTQRDKADLKKACVDPGTQFEVNGCASARFELSEAELDEADAAAQAKLAPGDPGRLAAYLAARDAWCAAREADCQFDSYGPGTIMPSLYNVCKEARNRTRTRGLNIWLRCQDSTKRGNLDADCSEPIELYSFDTPAYIFDVPTDGSVPPKSDKKE